MPPLSESAWHAIGLFVSFMIASAASGQDRYREPPSQRILRQALYLGAVFGTLQRMWLGVAATLMIAVYEEILVRRRRPMEGRRKSRHGAA
jgi:hypothetical protein